MSENQNEKIIAKTSAVFWSAIYTLLIPYFSYVAILAGRMLKNAQSPIPISTIITTLLFLLPLSMGFSLYLIWLNFREESYKRSIFSAFLPFVTFGFILLMIKFVIPLLV